MNFTLMLSTSATAIDSVVITSIEVLQEYLALLHQHEFGELWLHAVAGQALAVLWNDNRAFMMYLREEGDPGTYAYEPEHQGTSKGTIEFRLANGQSDVHPLSDTVSLEAVVPAVEYFVLNRDTDPRLIWRDAA